MPTLARYLKLSALALTLWLMAACSSGLKAYQKGDYYKASVQAAERLRSKPTHQKAQTALANAYPMAVQNASRMINNALASGSISQVENIIGIYNDMNALADLIHRSPAALRIVPDPVEYHEELRSAHELAAELSYQAGIKAMAYGTLEQARVAYQHFQKTLQHIPAYKDAAAKLEQARYAATLRVVVVKPVTGVRYALDAEFFYNRLMTDITKRSYKNLVRFYTPEEAGKLGMRDPHEVLVLNFEDFSVGNTKESSNTYEVKRDSVLVGTTKVNGVNRNVYGTVKATFTLNRIEIISQGILSVRILDPNTSKVIRHKNFAGTSVWRSEWAHFNGDERALNQEQKSLVGRKPLPPPPPQELFASFANPLYDDAARYINSMY